MDSLNDEKEADIAPAHKKAARKDASKQFAQSRVDFLKIEKKTRSQFSRVQKSIGSARHERTQGSPVDASI
jgi:serine/threonine-protein kinase RIO1